MAAHCWTQGLVRRTLAASPAIRQVGGEETRMPTWMWFWIAVAAGLAVLMLVAVLLDRRWGSPNIAKAEDRPVGRLTKYEGGSNGSSGMGSGV